MKAVRELERATLSAEQKLGLLICADLTYRIDDMDLALEMIRNHALGGVWIQPEREGGMDRLRRVLEAADYPILIMCDAEQGFGDVRIPNLIALTAAGKRREAAYAFGRRSAALLRRVGVNAICNPLIDIAENKSYPCGGNTRTLGSDRETVLELSAAIAEGMHESGVLTVGKHYPFTEGPTPYDTHMREGNADMTADELRDSLSVFKALVGRGLLDGIMTGHMRFPRIDPDNPTTLSAPMIAFAREAGFDGFITTDALNMMGILSKHGRREPVALAVKAGNDIPLSMGLSLRESYEGLCEAYKNGSIPEATVEAALTRVLAAHHKVAELPKEPPLYEEDLLEVEAVSRNCIAAVCEEGLTPHLSREGRHLFTIVTNERADAESKEYTPGPRDWFFPHRIARRLLELFPNSEVAFHPIFPEGVDNAPYLNRQLRFDDVVFITSYSTVAYTGREQLTYRIVDLMDALQSTDRIAAYLHFGNPYVAAGAPYVKRMLLGYCSEACVMHGLEILAGNAEAVGIVPYDIEFHKKGDLFI